MGCICPVSCRWLTLTVLWVVAPTTWPADPGRGGLRSPTTTPEVQAALFRTCLIPMKKIPCKFLQFINQFVDLYFSINAHCIWQLLLSAGVERKKTLFCPRCCENVSLVNTENMRSCGSLQCCVYIYVRVYSGQTDSKGVYFPPVHTNH